MHQIENDFFIGSVDPENGGRLLSLYRKTVERPIPIIVPPIGGAVVGQKATAFPLIPFGGRLRHGRLSWDGATVQLPCPPSDHVLHGDALARPWMLLHHGRTSVFMTLDYPTAMWPFPAKVAVRYVIRGPVFRALFRVWNLSDTSIPFGLGWHPYFAARSSDRLHLSVDGFARLDPEGFSPEVRKEPGERVFSPEAGPGTWQCQAVPGPACLGGADGPSLELRFASTVSHIVVHVPPGGSAIAVEPLTHALHDPGYPPLGAGRSRTVNRHPIVTPYRRPILTPLELSWPGAA